MAYRILVASSRDKLAQDQNDLWDSGKIVSEQSHLVPYAGNPLSSGQIVDWKVKVWDKDGQESPWSDPAHFEMGMLNQADWKAQWITSDRVLVNNDVTEEWLRYVLLKDKAPESGEASNFRDNVAAADVLGKDFVLEQVPERARVYVSAKGFYELFLNGERISDEERNHVPTITGDRDEYLKKSFYVVYDVTSLLRQGENRLRCVLWPGYNHWQQWGKASNKTKNLSKFVLQLDGTTGGHMNTLVVTDDTWRQMTSPILKSAASLASYAMEGEVYDARIPDPCRGDLSIMTAACPPVKTTTGFPLCWRYMPPERVIWRVKPVTVFSPFRVFTRARDRPLQQW